MKLSDLRGQDTATGVLERAIAGDRVASSYLFEGPSGVGKQLAAMALACRVIGAGEETARRIREGSHPDVRVFEPRPDGKRNIQVETLREQILPIAQFAPFEEKAAFLIFPQADISFPEHPPESTNALLKTLEEPRPNVHFVLLSERPDRLLPTIRSRCQRLRFGRLPLTVIDEILAARGVDAAARGPAVGLSGGRADRALDLAEGGAQALLEVALEVDDLCATGGPGSLVRLGESLARSELPLADALDAVMMFYRDVAAAGLGVEDSALSFAHQAAVVRERAARVSPAEAARRVGMIEQSRLALERNANPQTTLDSLLYAARV